VRELQGERETLMQMVSHDLRTPLTVILGHGALLRRGAPDGETVRRRADAIVASAGRMQRLIQDMVDATRLDAGHLELRLEPVDLPVFLLTWKDRLAGALAVDRVTIAVPEAVPLVLADPSRLEQVVANLVTNALKYSAPGSEVVLRVEAVPGAVSFSVADRGPGIASQDLPRVFDRYYRGTGSASGDGLGLGLFITRKLVEAHGWQVRVESAVGQGSVFTVIMPVAEGAPRTSAVG
jgi:two-component system, OmpR family, phosphate regulon sensor histidine kinase PhoR